MREGGPPRPVGERVGVSPRSVGEEVWYPLVLCVRGSTPWHCRVMLQCIMGRPSPLNRQTRVKKLPFRNPRVWPVIISEDHENVLNLEEENYRVPWVLVGSHCEAANR